MNGTVPGIKVIQNLGIISVDLGSCMRRADVCKGQVRYSRARLWWELFWRWTQMFSAEGTAAGQADSQSESLCNVIWSCFICNMNAAIRKKFL